MKDSYMPGWSRFLDDLGGLECSKIRFRPEAPETDKFGLENRYRVIDGEMVWGWPGVHWGCDRGTAQNLTIYCPLPIDSGILIDWGPESMYGAEIVLRSWAGFLVRIAHVWPDKLQEHVSTMFKEGRPFDQGYPMGPIGAYGQGVQGAHTHTEVESLGESNALLEELLLRRWGGVAGSEYTSDEIVELYSACEKTKDWSSDQCLRDAQALKIDKGILFWNRWMIRRTWTRRSEGKINNTVYSSLLTMDF
jgi:hypothetical protein